MASIAESLQDKVALVTGGSRGIGRATVLALARAGARVAVNYKTRAADAEAVYAEIRSQGNHAVAVQADVSTAAEVTEMVRQVEGQLGLVSILVNNAGISRLQPFDQITEKDWDEVLAVNLKSVFLVTQVVLPGMRERRLAELSQLWNDGQHGMCEPCSPDSRQVQRRRAPAQERDRWASPPTPQPWASRWGRRGRTPSPTTELPDRTDSEEPGCSADLLTIHQLDRVMEGKLDDIIEGLIAYYQAEKLKQATVAA